MRDRGRPNLLAAAALLDGLVDEGLAHLALSPGSRSTPLALAAAARPGLSLSVHLDERSAAFCALGFARASGRPAAMACTSGTAGANAYGAVIEAWHSRLPLVILTADRPPELRASGAWQTIDQQRLFGGFLRDFHEAALPDELGDAEAARYFRDIGRRAARRSSGILPGPVQVNLPFREPLAPAAPGWAAVQAAGIRDQPPSEARDGPFVAPRSRRPDRPVDAARLSDLARDVRAAPQGLILAGLVDPPVLGVDARAYARALARLAAASGYPILAEPTGGLRFGSHDQALVIDGYDAFLRLPGWVAEHPPRLVLRFGGSLTWRPVTQYLEAHPTARHLVFDPLDQGDDPARLAADWLPAGAPEAALALAAALEGLGSRDAAMDVANAAWRRAWTQARDGAAEARLAAVAAAPEGSSIWLHAQLPTLLPPESLVVAANSMAVRDLDSFGGRSPKDIGVLANRGAAGIDGTLSTAIGAALHRSRAGLGPTVLVTGDLAFLHDINGLGIMGQDRSAWPDLTVILLNDAGGAIFGYLPVADGDAAVFDRCFRTDPGADLAAGCALYGVRHWLAEGRAGFAAAWEAARAAAGIRVIELRLDAAANRAAHRDYWQAVGEAWVLGSPGSRPAGAADLERPGHQGAASKR